MNSPLNHLLAFMGEGLVSLGPGEISMAIFDQRRQQVSYQYNAAGDINFGAV